MTTQSSKEQWENWAVITGALVAAVAFMVAYSIYVGLVMWWMWAWFVVPLGVSQISVAGAIGITLTLTLFMRPIMTSKAQKQAPPDWTDIVLRPAFVLLIGWTVKQFM